jgi:hypothetical protein
MTTAEGVGVALGATGDAEANALGAGVAVAWEHAAAIMAVTASTKIRR